MQTLVGQGRSERRDVRPDLRRSIHGLCDPTQVRDAQVREYNDFRRQRLRLGDATVIAPAPHHIAPQFDDRSHAAPPDGDARIGRFCGRSGGYRMGMVKEG
jgi:hypothetical protein